MRYDFLRFPNGKSKALTLSYDDGPTQDLRLERTLNKYGIKSTFNLNNYVFRKGRGLSDENVREFLANGHEIAVHGAMHKAEGLLRPIEGIKDVLECRLELEKKYGIIIRGMAYPDSGITRFVSSNSYERVKNYLQELDIAYSRTLKGDNDLFALPDDWYAWMPTAHHSNPDILTYIEKFVSLDISVNTYAATRLPKLFYMWGHSWEFDINNNWELLDEICEMFSGNEDIWFATNMEIYNYVNAYNALVYSADGNMIYNPALCEVWFDRDGVLHNIKPGETISV